MRWFAAGLVGLVALGGGYFGVQQRGDVEAGIQERVESVLADAPEFARVTLDEMATPQGGVWGRAVYLQGRVADSTQLEALQAAVANAGGVRKVVMDQVLEVPLVANAADYTFSAAKSGDDIKVVGLAGSADAQRELIALSGEALDAREDQLNISLADPMPEGWVNSVSAGLAQLQGLSRGSLLVTGSEAVLSGTATTADSYRAAVQFPAVMEAEGAMPGRIGTLDLALDRYTFDARKAAAQVSLSGGMPDQETLEAVEAYAAQTFPGVEIASGLLVSSGVPTQSWGSDARAAIDALRSYETGRAYMGTGGVALVGTLFDGAAQGQTREQIEARLSANTRLLTSGTRGEFFTDVDRARLDLFSTFGTGETETLNGFVLGKPAFELTAPECIAQQVRLMNDFPITFNNNEASPNVGGGLTLDALAGISRACDAALVGYEITAKGYQGVGEDATTDLSQNRAEAVVAALAERGVDTSAFTAVGRGVDQPDTASAPGAFVELGFFDRVAADAQEAARQAEQARRDAVADALGDVTGYEDVNGFQIPVVTFEASLQTCSARFADFLSKATILFASGSAELREESLQVIDGVAGIARTCADAVRDTQVEIAGHTDSQGDDALNQSLSEARATAVLDAIAARGISTAAYRAVGFGETRPTADNSTPEGREANRRIEFIIIANTPEPEVPSEETPGEETAAEVDPAPAE